MVICLTITYEFSVCIVCNNALRLIELYTINSECPFTYLYKIQSLINLHIIF